MSSRKRTFRQCTTEFARSSRQFPAGLLDFAGHALPLGIPHSSQWFLDVRITAYRQLMIFNLTTVEQVGSSAPL